MKKRKFRIVRLRTGSIFDRRIEVPPKFKRETIVINYPPEFDGQLLIEAVSDMKKVNPSWTFQFTRSEEDGSAWDTLVQAASEIINQEARMLVRRHKEK
jgi:hypothetical protein